jgi:thiol-disulfide isomerase/thioredoxin
MTNGKKFTLSKEKGNVVMIDYWATWCPPCRASLPHLNEISQDKDLAAKGLKVYAINDKETKPVIDQFMKQNNFSFLVPIDIQGQFGQKYLVRGIPTTVIVGRDGSVKKVFIGFGEGMEKEIKAEVEKALDEKGPTT